MGSNQVLDYKEAGAAGQQLDCEVWPADVVLKGYWAAENAKAFITVLPWRLAVLTSTATSHR